MPKALAANPDAREPVPQFDPVTVNAVLIYRHAAGMSRKGLALAVGASLQTIWLWESGRAFPSDEYRAKLAAVLGVNARRLLTLLKRFDRTQSARG